MTREQRLQAEMLARSLLALLKRSDPFSDTPTGHCEFCARAPRGSGWRMDVYLLGHRKVFTCSLCLGSLSQAYQRVKPELRIHEPDYWKFKHDPFNVAPQMLVAEWVAKRLLSRAKTHNS